MKGNVIGRASLRRVPGISYSSTPECSILTWYSYMLSVNHQSNSRHQTNLHTTPVCVSVCVCLRVQHADFISRTMPPLITAIKYLLKLV